MDLENFIEPVEDTVESKRAFLEKAISMMEVTAKIFYANAVTIQVHQFIEFAGFMNEYIKMCRTMHAEGTDFVEVKLQAKDYEMEYIAEKFDCIFGETLQDPKNRAAFLRGLEKKGGWKFGSEV